MAEIGINEYVRTKSGKIDKVIETTETSILTKQNLIKRGISTSAFYTGKEDIKSHSKNIIDLIEVRRLCEWRKNNYNIK